VKKTRECGGKWGRENIVLDWGWRREHKKLGPYYSWFGKRRAEGEETTPLEARRKG